MDYFWFMTIFVVWYALSLIISEKIGKKNDIGEEWSFFLCIMLSPVIGFFIAKYFRRSKA